jgi:hypothetical protein
VRLVRPVELAPDLEQRVEVGLVLARDDVGRRREAAERARRRVPRHAAHVVHVRVREQDRRPVHGLVGAAADVEGELQLGTVDARLDAPDGQALDPVSGQPRHGARG